MDIHILIDKKRFKFSQLIAMQKGDLEVTRDVIAQNMTCPGGEYMDKFEAIAMLDELDGEQLEGLIETFEQAMEDVYQNAVPLANSAKLSRRSRMAAHSRSGPG
jgi:hypothetical protein